MQPPLPAIAADPAARRLFCCRRTPGRGNCRVQACSPGSRTGQVRPGRAVWRRAGRYAPPRPCGPGCGRRGRQGVPAPPGRGCSRRHLPACRTPHVSRRRRAGYCAVRLLRQRVVLLPAACRAAAAGCGHAGPGPPPARLRGPPCRRRRRAAWSGHALARTCLPGIRARHRAGERQVPGSGHPGAPRTAAPSCRAPAGCLRPGAALRGVPSRRGRTRAVDGPCAGAAPGNAAMLHAAARHARRPAPPSGGGMLKIFLCFCQLDVSTSVRGSRRQLACSSLLQDAAAFGT